MRPSQGDLILPGSATQRSAPSYHDNGPWALSCSSNSVQFICGNLYNGSMSKLMNINGFSQQFEVSPQSTIYLNLVIEISNGSAISATIEQSSKPPSNSAAGSQTTLGACLAVVGTAVGGYIYYGSSTRYEVFRACRTDLIIMGGCNGLVLVPAPYSLP